MANGFFLGGFAEGAQNAERTGLQRRMVDVQTRGMEMAQSKQLSDVANQRMGAMLKVMAETVQAAKDRGADQAAVDALLKPLSTPLIKSSLMAQAANVQTAYTPEVLQAQIQNIRSAPSATEQAALAGKAEAAHATGKVEGLIAGGVSPDVARFSIPGAKDAAQIALSERSVGIQAGQLALSRANAARSAQVQSLQMEKLQQEIDQNGQFKPYSAAGKIVADIQNAERLFGKDSPQSSALMESLDAELAGDSPNINDEAGQRKEFTKLSSEFIKVKAAYETVKASVAAPADTQQVAAAKDVSMIFAFMKILDPTSVVREGEQATASNTAGVDDRIRNIYNRLLTGQRLSPEQRQGFMETAKGIYSQRVSAQTNLEDEFTGLAKRSGLRPENTVINFRSKVNTPGITAQSDLDAAAEGLLNAE